MKTYYNVLMLSESKRAVAKTSSKLALTEREIFLLQQDIEEIELLLNSLRRMIAGAYGVATFEEVATEVLRFIEEDPYHKFTTSLYGPNSKYDYATKAIAGGFFSFNKNNDDKKDIN